MPQQARQRTPVTGGSRFWMRAMSFAGLHRMLQAAASAPNRRTTAIGLNDLVLQSGSALTKRPGIPSRTTFYHYRTALLRLGALRRNGRVLSVNDKDPRVQTLLSQSAPANGEGLSETARDGYAALVLHNEDCRTLFFDLFLPASRSAWSASAFRQEGIPVLWRRDGPPKSRRVVFAPPRSARSCTYSSPVEIAAILYGIRYWARDELGLIDEYVGSADGWATMFPVSQQVAAITQSSSHPPPLARSLLQERGPGEWTLFSVSDLIARYCRDGRQPIAALSGAIDWLVRNWPDHTALIATSRAVATLAATSPQQEGLVLRRYYKAKAGPYISHIRLHAGIVGNRAPPSRSHVATPAQSQAHV